MDGLRSPDVTLRLLSDHSHNPSPLLLDTALFGSSDNRPASTRSFSSSSSTSAMSDAMSDEKQGLGHTSLTLSPPASPRPSSASSSRRHASRGTKLLEQLSFESLTWHMSRVMASRRFLVLVLLGATGLLALYDLTHAAESRVASRKTVTKLSQKIHKWTETGYRDDPDARNVEYEPFNKSLVLNFDEPQPLAFSQLKQGLRYATTIGYGGHANQFISLTRIVYYAKISNRIAIIPTLFPLHFPGKPLRFSTFYDVNRLWQETQIPVVEMADLKPIDFDQTKDHDEDISCWSVMERVSGQANMFSPSMDCHDIWVNPWPLPEMKRADNGFDVAFESLKLFDHDWWARSEWIDKIRQEMLPQRTDNEHPPPEKSANMKDGFDTIKTNPPDDRFLCVDNSLFVGPVTFPPAIMNELEADNPGNPEESWTVVGQHMHFNNHVESIVDQYLMQIFGVSKISKVPPFITVHIRRTDFQHFAGFTTLDKYQEAVGRVRKRLQRRLTEPWAGPGRENFKSFGINADKYAVLATTDEAGTSDFVAQVKALGWKVLDHDEMKTIELYNAWYPTMLDAAVLARGRAFVGTPKSTFSGIAADRVKYWRGGPVEMAQ